MWVEWCGVGGGVITPTELGCKCLGACPAGRSGSEWLQWEMELLLAMVVCGGMGRVVVVAAVAAVKMLPERVLTPLSSTEV